MLPPPAATALSYWGRRNSTGNPADLTAGLYNTMFPTSSSAEAQAFITTLGVSSSAGGYDYSRGMYKDDNGDIRLMGAYYNPATEAFGIVSVGSGGPFIGDATYYQSGTYLARPSAVPLPAAAWLFGSALFGLVGVARRKKA
jgi:hypothetical protein